MRAATQEGEQVCVVPHQGLFVVQVDNGWLLYHDDGVLRISNGEKERIGGEFIEASAENCNQIISRLFKEIDIILQGVNREVARWLTGLRCDNLKS